MIKEIHSCTVVVRDQNQAVEFFTSKLGFEKVLDVEMGQNDRFIVVRLPNTETGIALASVEGVERNEGWKPEVGHYTGISFVTDDVPGTYEELRGRGVEFTEPPQQMPWGALATWLKDPDGNTYFLTQADQ